MYSGVETGGLAGGSFLWWHFGVCLTPRLAPGSGPPSVCRHITSSPSPARQDAEPRPGGRSAARPPATSLAWPSVRLRKARRAWVLGPGAQGRWCWHWPRPLCARERAASRPRELTRPRVSAGIPAPALNMPVIFISLRQAAKAIPPVAAAAATQCFPLVGRGNGGRPDFLITWC